VVLDITEKEKKEKKKIGKVIFKVEHILQTSNINLGPHDILPLCKHCRAWPTFHGILIAPLIFLKIS